MQKGVEWEQSRGKIQERGNQNSREARGQESKDAYLLKDNQKQTIQKKPLLDHSRPLSCKANSSSPLWMHGNTTGLHSCRAEQLVSQVSQDVFADTDLCSRISNSRSTFVAKVTQVKKASSPKASVPCSCTHNTSKWLKAEKRTRIHYWSACKGMHVSILCVGINTNPFVKLFSCALDFLPLSVVPHVPRKGWPLLLHPQMGSSAC